MILVLSAGCSGTDLTGPPRPPDVTACGLIGRDCDVVRGTRPWAAGLADLDADADLDLAVVLHGSDGVALWLNDGSGAFIATDVLVVGDSPRSVSVGDFDGDGDPDLAVTGLVSVVGPAVSVLANQGNATFAPAANFPTGHVSTFVTAADLDGDGSLDLVTADEGADSLSILLNNGDGTFAEPRITTAGAAPASIAGADLDGDGDVDLAVANRASDDVSILINIGDGTFRPAVNCAVGDVPGAIAAGDFDGDGDLDLATANEGGFDDPDLDDVSVLINDGTGAFYAAATLAVGVNPYAITSGDLDGDADVDLVVANHGITGDTSTIAVLRNHGDGTFAPAVSWPAGWGPESVVLGDLDGDGDLDAVTANSLANNVSFLANDGSGEFASGI